MYILSPLLVASSASTVAAQCDTVETGYQCDTDISHNWGNYAPYFSIPSNISNETPPGCTISFVNLLSRHGARFPTTSKTTDYEELFEQIDSDTTSYSAAYAFIKNYTYSLGANDLTAFGQQEMINSGIKFYGRYKALTELYTPFFRSSSDGRVVGSAQNFSQGFHQARGAVDPTYPYPIEVISEDSGQNNTLYAQLCTNYEDGPDSDISDDAEDTWRDVWIADVKTRVNDNLVGASLSKSQIIYLMDQCPFNTISHPAGTLSPFCALFNTTEWTSYAYYRTLSKWRGFAAELLARMTSNLTYVTSKNSYTSINHTLDSSAAAFPLGPAYPLYADFSHDDDLSSIFAALGLYNGTKDLSNTTLESTSQTGGYSVGWTVPFAARAYFEKM
ncbi:3-phytase A, partial [Lachnellula suecica]